ncbi:hypothetical protein A5888_001644 [Enterococcus sp. 9E7_DIV0242]|uniref:Uncharacterized protein n=2 Tax=Candidatus Enterococcus clewellii TaxID=1834193 RepID=A0A242K4Z8_9ENTE|nr:hypothetical protein A5888_003170 [Enterococcus sp. 9E7_DIV0242]
MLELKNVDVEKVSAVYLYDFHGMKICYRKENGEYIIFDAVSGYRVSSAATKQLAIAKATKALESGDSDWFEKVVKILAPWYGIPFLGTGQFSPIRENSLMGKKKATKRYYSRISRSVEKYD